MTKPQDNTQVTPVEAAQAVIKGMVDTYHEILLDMRQRELAKSQPELKPEVRPMKSPVFDLIKRTQSCLNKAEIPGAPKPPQAPGAKPIMNKDEKPSIDQQRAKARLDKNKKKRPIPVPNAQEVQKDEKTPSPKFKHGDKVKLKGREDKGDMTFDDYHPKEKGTVRVFHSDAGRPHLYSLAPGESPPGKTVHYNEDSIEHSAVNVKKDEMTPAKQQQKDMSAGTSASKPAATAMPVNPMKAAATGLHPASPGAASVGQNLAATKYHAGVAGQRMAALQTKLKTPALMSGIKR